MSQIAKGTFRVDLQPLASATEADGLQRGRMSIDKVFEGDLAGTSRGEMLSALTSAKTSGGYVAIEQVTGSLHGRAGCFVLQHSGTRHDGAQQLSIHVVPGTGSGALAGLAGEFRLRIEGGIHYYELEYTLP